MKIQVDPEAREELIEFFRRAECTVRAEDESTLVVDVPDANGEDQARLEVDLYLKAWHASHPEVETHLLGAPPSRIEGEARTSD